MSSVYFRCCSFIGGVPQDCIIFWEYPEVTNKSININSDNTDLCLIIFWVDFKIVQYFVKISIYLQLIFKFVIYPAYSFIKQLEMTKMLRKKS